MTCVSLSGSRGINFRPSAHHIKSHPNELSKSDRVHTAGMGLFMKEAYIHTHITFLYFKCLRLTTCIKNVCYFLISIEHDCLKVHTISFMRNEKLPNTLTCCN